MVNPHLRGLRIGHGLGRSYLVYAPKLLVLFSRRLLVVLSSFFQLTSNFSLSASLSGYRASVFNLVYTSSSLSSLSSLPLLPLHSHTHTIFPFLLPLFFSHRQPRLRPNLGFPRLHSSWSQCVYLSLRLNIVRELVLTRPVLLSSRFVPLQSPKQVFSRKPMDQERSTWMRLCFTRSSISLSRFRTGILWGTFRSEGDASKQVRRLGLGTICSAGS